jgi:cytoskeletal protein CcmA (bactofilin family)
MFSKFNKEKPVVKKTKQINTTVKEELKMSNNAPSIIGSDVVITGNIVTQGEIQLDGKVEGDIRSSALTIGESGIVVGSVSASEVIIKGTVKGQINARSIRLEKTSKVTGDLIHESLSIEAGAFIEGSLKHQKNANAVNQNAGQQAKANTKTITK